MSSVVEIACAPTRQYIRAVAQTISIASEYRSYTCPDTQAFRMVRDAACNLPAMLDAGNEDELSGIKNVRMKKESNDGQPVLFEKQSNLNVCYSDPGALA